MTRPIYEPTTQRQIASQGYADRQLLRRPAPVSSGGGTFTVFRAKMTEIEDPETNTYHFLSGQEGQNVFWNSWDPNYDTTVFDISAYEENTFGYDMIGGVGLLKNGLYSISCVVDLQDVFDGFSLFNTNWDEGQGIFRVHNNYPGTAFPGPNASMNQWWVDWLQHNYPGTLGYGTTTVPYWGDLYGIRADQWRQCVDLPPVPDTLWGGEAETVENVLSVMTIGNVSGGSGGSPYDDMWIPGGYNGAWGLVPNLIVIYWGETDGDPDWPAEGL